MNMLKIILLNVIFVIGGCLSIGANTETFLISASIPAATGGSFAVSSVVGSSFTLHNSNSLTFGTLTYDSVNDIFGGSNYYAIDIGAVGGAGFPNITVSYLNTGSPQNATTTLGNHGIFSYSKITQNNGSEVETLIDGLSLNQADGLNISPSQFSNGHLRVNIGIATGSSSSDEGDATPFRASLKSGNYTGTLTITATVQ